MEYGDIHKLFKQRKEAYDKYCYDCRCKDISEFFTQTAKECGFDVSNVKVQGNFVAYSVKINGKDIDSIIDFEHVIHRPRPEDIYFYKDYIRHNLETIKQRIY